MPRLILLALVAVGQAMMVKATSLHHALLQTEREQLIKQWAPLVWLHSNEHFYPSSVIDFLQHTKPSKQGRGYPLVINNGYSEVILSSLPRGNSSWDTHLLASYNTECQNCRKPNFLYGKKPGRHYTPPTYATIHSCAHQRQKKEHSTNPDLNHHGFLNDKSILGDTYSIESDYSKDNEPLSLSNQNISMHSRKLQETSTKPATTLPLSSTVNTRQTDNESQSQYFKTLQNDSNYSSLSQSKESILNLTNNINRKNISIENSSTDTSLHKIESKQINFETITVNTKSKLLSTLIPKSQFIDEYAESSTSEQWPPNSTEDSVNLYAHHSQHRQGTRIKRNKIHNIVNENSHTSHMTPTEREVINDPKEQFSVTYWMFYPYNYAKDICTMNLGFFGRTLQPTINGVCHGKNIPMGNHVGDWEHVTIHFKGQVPTKLYISSHSFGAYYAYDSHNHVFHYISQDTRKGVSLSPEYPNILTLHGNHPIVFAALGSHGLWPTQGIHKYNSFPALDDKTDFGTPWHTWNNLEIIDLKQSNTISAIQRHWLSYEGYWGNPSSKCYTLMGGFCEINRGPTGIPRKRINFPCPS